MKLKFLLVIALSGSPISYAHDWDLSVSDSPAAIGVMGDHTLKTGELMLSYRYMNMNMSGNREGNNRLSAEEVLNGPDGVRAERRTDLGIGVNYLVRSGFFKGHRLAIEYSQLIQQNLAGPQLEVDSTFHIRLAKNGLMKAGITQ